MKPALRIIDIVLYSSVFTACCALGLCMATERLISDQQLSLCTWLHALVFGSTLIVYNAPKLVLRKDRHTRLERGWYTGAFAAGFSFTAGAMYFLPARTVMLSLLLGLFAFAYMLPLLPGAGRRRLREFGKLKILVLAGVWTTATSILPMVNGGLSLAAFPLEIALRFLFIFTLCVIFDIRDMHTDKQNNIFTLPHMVGVANSYRVIYAALVSFAALSVLQYLWHPHPARLFGAMVTATATALVALYLKQRPSERGYLLMADGVMVLYSVLVLLQ